jgi:transketolase
MLAHDGPVYLRLTRQKVADVSRADQAFRFGSGVVLREGSDLVIVASGAVVGHALEGADLLARDGIQAAVLNIHTIKPIDAPLLLEWASRVGRVLTVEDHSIHGGLGSAVCEVVCEGAPAVVYRHGVRDFGESGSAEDLYRKHQLHGAGIAAKAREILEREGPRASTLRRHVS